MACEVLINTRMQRGNILSLLARWCLAMYVRSCTRVPSSTNIFLRWAFLRFSMDVVMNRPSKSISLTVNSSNSPIRRPVRASSSRKRWSSSLAAADASSNFLTSDFVSSSCALRGGINFSARQSLYLYLMTSTVRSSYLKSQLWIQGKFCGMQSAAFLGQKHHIPQPLLMAYSPCKSLPNDLKRHPNECERKYRLRILYGDLGKDLMCQLCAMPLQSTHKIFCVTRWEVLESACISHLLSLGEGSICFACPSKGFESNTFVVPGCSNGGIVRS